MIGTVGAVTFLHCFGDGLADRPPPASVGILPGKTITLTRSANDSLRVLVHAIVLFQSVFLLRFDETTADLDGVQFVLPDAAEKYLIASGLGIVEPLSISIDQRDGKRPGVISKGDLGTRGILPIDSDRMCLMSQRDQCSCTAFVFHGI